jgi:glycosyltransferase involved in cell wall biosynthesis
MMRGSAVVASDIGGLTTIVDHAVTGLRVAPGDDHALADALVRLLSDRGLAERLGAAGRDRARGLFSLDRCVSAFETLYEALLHPEPVPAHAC